MKLIALSLVAEAVVAVGLIWIIRPTSSPIKNLTQHASHLAPGVVISDISVTTALRHQNSALRLTIANGTNNAIILNSVSSPHSRRAMLHYDVNMCGSGSSMTTLPNVEIGPHEIAHLGYRGLGAMLLALDHQWSVGSQVVLTVNWLDALGRDHQMPVTASVVAQPPHLQYVTASSMAGMSM